MGTAHLTLWKKWSLSGVELNSPSEVELLTLSLHDDSLLLKNPFHDLSSESHLKALLCSKNCFDKSLKLKDFYTQ